MRKLTKGFLIFGVVTSIIGFAMMIIGIQTDGIRGLLAMSQNQFLRAEWKSSFLIKILKSSHVTDRTFVSH